MVDVSFTMIMQWFNFGILLFLMHKFLFKPLTSFLDSRAKDIENDINEASDKKQEADKVLAQYEEKMKEIGTEADKIVEEARKEAQKEKSRILEEAQSDAKNIVQKAQKDVLYEVEKAKQELTKTISDLTISCAAKVLEREVSETDHKKFIDSFLEKESV